MKPIKHLIPAGAAVLCCVLLQTGCGKSKKDESKPASGQTVVKVWAHEGQPYEKAALESVITGFQKANPEIRVDLQFKQEQGYGDRVNAAVISGQLPDIIDIDGPYTAHFADIGALSPVGNDLPRDCVGDFLQTIRKQGTIGDNLYTLGTFDSTVVIFYDAKLAAECGISPPQTVEKAWSWDEFIAALKAVKEKKPDMLPVEMFMSWGGEWLTYAFTPLIWSKGGAIISPETGKASGSLDSQQNVRVMTAFQELFASGLADVNAPPGQFRRGKAAMAWGVFNRWPIYKEAGIDFKMAVLPAFKTPSSPCGSWCWGITSQCRDRESAAKVLQWMLSPSNGIVPVCKANGGIPARNAALNLMPEYMETRGIFVDQLKNSGHPRPITPHYGTVTKALSRAIADIARGADVQKSLADAAREIDKVVMAD